MHEDVQKKRIGDLLQTFPILAFDVLPVGVLVEESDIFVHVEVHHPVDDDKECRRQPDPEVLRCDPFKFVVLGNPTPCTRRQWRMDEMEVEQNVQLPVGP